MMKHIYQQNHKIVTDNIRIATALKQIILERPNIFYRFAKSKLRRDKGRSVADPEVGGGGGAAVAAPS